MESINITSESIVRQVDSFISSNLEESVVMMDIEKGQYYSLNSVGAKIWEMTDNPIYVKDLCEYLTNNFDIDTEQCEREVVFYLKQLLDLDIITIN